MPNKQLPDAPAYLIYVRSVAGVCPQIWRDKPNPNSDYWNNRRSGFERIVGDPVPLPAYWAAKPLYMIERTYPPVAAE